MRLTEGLFKVFYSRSIAKGKTKQLNAAMQQHLNLKDRIKEVEGDGGKKTWKKCALKGYECYAFSKPLPADSNNQAESAIERVIRETFPPRVEQSQSSAGAASGKAIKRARALTPKEKRCAANCDVANETAEQEARFTELSCQLWRRFHVVTKQMRSKNPDDPALKTFGQTCRDLGARWCLFMPRNRCSSLYLHTLMMHGGQFMSYLLTQGLTIGMLENSGAERRHQIGKLHFRKSLGTGGTLYFAMTGAENRSAYLTLRGLLIWQYGRDLLAYYLVLDKEDSAASAASGAKRIHGWEAAVESHMGRDTEADGVLKRTRAIRGVASRETVMDEGQRVHHDLMEDDLEEMEAATEETDDSVISDVINAIYPLNVDSAPVMAGKGGNNSGFINLALPIVRSSGEFISQIDGQDRQEGETSSEEEGSDIDRSVLGSMDDDDDGDRESDN